MALNNTTANFQLHLAMNLQPFINDDPGQTQENLNRFTSSAESIYKALTTYEERTIFYNIIRLKLSNEAYTRKIDPYPGLKAALKEIYAEPQILEKLKRNYKKIEQRYNETLRNYGCRILEALEKYKQD